MPKMRTLPKALEEIREKDPGCMLTLAQLRRWAKSGTIKAVRIGDGKNFLCDLDALERFLAGEE